MDRRWTESPVYARQWSGGSSSTGSSSPVGSPAHPRSRLPPAAAGMSTIKRTQNVAAKAAAQRLAQVMASQATADDDDEEDDLGFRFAGSGSVSTFSSNTNGLAAVSLGRPNRSPSPALGRNFMEHTPAIRSTSAGRPSMSVRANAASVVPQGRSTLRTPTAIPPVETASNRSREKRFTPDVGRSALKGSSNVHDDALCDETKGNDGEGHEFLISGQDGATSGHAESLSTTLTEHQHHLAASIQASVLGAVCDRVGAL